MRTLQESILSSTGAGRKVFFMSELLKLYNLKRGDNFDDFQKIAKPTFIKFLNGFFSTEKLFKDLYSSTVGGCIVNSGNITADYTVHYYFKKKRGTYKGDTIVITHKVYTLTVAGTTCKYQMCIELMLDNYPEWQEFLLSEATNYGLNVFGNTIYGPLVDKDGKIVKK